MPAEWLRSVHIGAGGAHHEEVPLIGITSDQRVDRVLLDWHVNVVTQDSAVLQTWLDRGIIVAMQWVEGEIPVTPPDDIGEAGLSDIDVLWSSYERLEASTIFLGWYVAPAQGGSVRVDTPVHRRPQPGNTGFVYLTWGLADFAGAGVEVGFSKAFSRILIDDPTA